MSAIAKLRQRLLDLQEEARQLAPQGRTFVVTVGDTTPQSIAWLSAAAAALALLIPDMFNAYRKKIESLVTLSTPASAVQNVATASAMLHHVVTELDAGTLLSIADSVSAETFEDLLDHAEAYLRKNRKDPAGVLSGVVFEDAARRVYRSVMRKSDKGQEIEQIIIQLTSHPPGGPILTDIRAARARVAAKVRAKATHAQWEELNESDVAETIKFTREFIAANIKEKH
jgi:hypothetical protein